MRRTSDYVALLLGVVLIGGGLLRGAVAVSEDCGSVFSPTTPQIPGFDFDTAVANSLIEAGCESDRNAAAALMWVLLIIGFILCVYGVVCLARGVSRGDWERIKREEIEAEIAIERSEQTTVVAPLVPAGWYADPDGRPVQRYWDGNAWTDQTVPIPPAGA
jgi:hypothetical protein